MEGRSHHVANDVWLPGASPGAQPWDPRACVFTGCLSSRVRASGPLLHRQEACGHGPHTGTSWSPGDCEEMNTEAKQQLLHHARNGS